MTTIAPVLARDPFRLPSISLKESVRLTAVDAKMTGRRIRTARAWADLSRAGLADALGVSESTIVRMEKGRRTPSRSELFYIAEICGVERSWFIGEAEVSPSEALAAFDASVGDLEHHAKEAQRQESEHNGESVEPKKN